MTPDASQDTATDEVADASLEATANATAESTPDPTSASDTTRTTTRPATASDPGSPTDTAAPNGATSATSSDPAPHGADPSTGQSTDPSTGPDAGTAPGSRLHSLAVELGALARNGLTYNPDRYATARYHRIHAIAAEIMGLLAQTDPAEFRMALAAEAGHATPKVDVRGALVEDGRVLLVQEARDGRWTLPGGWADALDTPSAAVEREFAEEAGLTVRATKLAAVYDGSRRNGHANSPWHIYKLFFLVSRVDAGAAPRAGLDGETSAVGFFPLDDLPELSSARTTAEQLATLIAHAADPRRPTDFD